VNSNNFIRSYINNNFHQCSIWQTWQRSLHRTKIGCVHINVSKLSNGLHNVRWTTYQLKNIKYTTTSTIVYNEEWYVGVTCSSVRPTVPIGGCVNTADAIFLHMKIANIDIRQMHIKIWMTICSMLPMIRLYRLSTKDGLCECPAFH
jgi:hypothetical protein